MNTLTNIEYLKSDFIDPRPEQAMSYPKIPLLFFKFLLNTIGRIFPGSFAALAYRIFSTPRSRAKHRKSDALLEQVHRFDFQHNNRKLKGYQWGSGDQIVLLVHGWESRGTALRGFVPDLIAAGYRVVAFDGPAHGDSEGERANILNFGSAIKSLIEHLDAPIAAAITHSFGGACIVYMLANEGRAIQIDKLVLIAASSSTKQIMDNYLDLVGAPDAVRKKWFEFIASKIQIPLETIDVSTSNTKINVNTAMILHDEMDPITPISEAKKIASSWKDTILVITKGYGHFRLMKNPDVVKRVTRFIVDDIQ